MKTKSIPFHDFDWNDDTLCENPMLTKMLEELEKDKRRIQKRKRTHTNSNLATRKKKETVTHTQQEKEEDLQSVRKKQCISFASGGKKTKNNPNSNDEGEEVREKKATFFMDSKAKKESKSKGQTKNHTLCATKAIKRIHTDTESLQKGAGEIETKDIISEEQRRGEPRKPDAVLSAQSCSFLEIASQIDSNRHLETEGKHFGDSEDSEDSEVKKGEPCTYLAKLYPHKRDKRIVLFDIMPDGREHVYLLDGKIELKSVSRLVSEYFPEFPEDKIIKNMMQGPNWNYTHRYWGNGIEGNTADDIKEIWKKNRERASKLGTLLHHRVEKVYDRFAQDPKQPELELFNNLPLNLPEYKQIEIFHHEVVKGLGLIPYRTEWRLFVRKYLLAGTPDIIFKQGEDFILMDWKRVELKQKCKYRNDPDQLYGYFPVHELENCNYQKYCVNLSLYKFILDTYYQTPIKEMYLAVFHPTRETYGVYSVPYLEQQVQELLSIRLDELALRGSVGGSASEEVTEIVQVSTAPQNNKEKTNSEAPAHTTCKIQPTVTEGLSIPTGS